MRGQLCEAVFAGRPQPAPPSDPVHDLIRAGRRIDAIALLRSREGGSLADAKAQVEALARDLAS